MSYVWYESYKAVVLETDWTKMHDRIQSAECKMHDRQRELSADHGGTPEERQAILNALKGMRTVANRGSLLAESAGSSESRKQYF